MKTRMTIAALAAALALGISACGGDDDGGDAGSRGEKTEAGVKDTLKSYIGALKDGDSTEACDLLTDNAKKDGGGGEDKCVEQVTATSLAVPADQFDAALKAVDTATVSIEGDTARATAFGGWPASTYRYEDGKWYIDSTG